MYKGYNSSKHVKKMLSIFQSKLVPNFNTKMFCNRRERKKRTKLDIFAFFSSENPPSYFSLHLPLLILVTLSAFASASTGRSESWLSPPSCRFSQLQSPPASSSIPPLVLAQGWIEEVNPKPNLPTLTLQSFNLVTKCVFNVVVWWIVWIWSSNCNFEYCKWLGVYGELRLDVNGWVLFLPILALKLWIQLCMVVLDGVWRFINGCLRASPERDEHRL